MENYNIHDFIDFEIKGDGTLCDYMKFQFKFFRQGKKESGKNNFIVNIGEIYNEGIVQELKGDNEKYIKLNDGKFIWKVKKSSCALDGRAPLKNQIELQFDNRFPKMKSNNILDLILRSLLVDKGLYLAHACCVENYNGALLMPAWKGVGKTETCLKLVEEGDKFLGDDKVWVSTDGLVYAYPRYAVIKDSNASEFPEFTNNKTKLKLFIREKIDRNRNIFKNRYLNRIKKKLLNIPVSYYYIEELYPQTKISTKAVLNCVLTLTKYNHDNIDFKSISRSKLIKKIKNISDVEWNYELLNLASAHDTLYPDGPSWKEELDDLFEQESELMSISFENIMLKEVRFPSDKSKIDWELFKQKVASF